MPVKSLLTFLLLGACMAATAQDVLNKDTLPYTRGYYGIAIGAGFPLQSFVKKDFSNELSGFANTGSNLQLNFNYFLVKHLGIMGRANINTNPYDVYELAKSYNTTDTFNNYNYRVNSKNWYCAGGMAGLNYAVAIHYFLLEFHMLAGYQYAESPRVSVTLSTGTDSTTLKLSKGTSSGLVWTAGTDLAYQLSNRFSVALGVEYYAFKGRFRNSQVFIDDKPLSTRDDFNMNIYLLNCTAAVRYHF